jgi:hypothetical protein
MVVRRSFPFLLSRDGHGSYSTFRFGTRHAYKQADASRDRRFLKASDLDIGGNSSDAFGK